MKFTLILAAAALIASPAFAAPVANAPHAKARAKAPPKTPAKVTSDKPASNEQQAFFHPSEVRSSGSVKVGGQPIAFDAVAGTLVVHAKEWEDTDLLDAGTGGDKSD